MDRETLQSRIQEIGQCEDSTDRISLLTALMDDTNQIFDNVDELNTTITNLNTTIEDNKQTIDKLQKANMDLFMRVGVNKTEKEKQEELTGLKDEEPEKLKFEDLFK